MTVKTLDPEKILPDHTYAAIQLAAALASAVKTGTVALEGSPALMPFLKTWEAAHARLVAGLEAGK